MAEPFLVEGVSQEKTTNDMKLRQRAHYQPMVTMEKRKIVSNT